MSKKIGILGAFMTLILGGVMVGSVTFAIDTIAEGYQVDVGIPKVISAHGYARIITTTLYKIFVPTKTAGEWTSFISNVEIAIPSTTVGAASRTYTCNAKPGAATTIRNTVTNYTQTSTDGIVWTPADDPTTDYNPSGSATECRYTCAGGYTWDGVNCINSRTYTCNAKPGGATTVRNTVSSYGQSRNGSAWTPADDATTDYNPSGSATECRYTCAGGYLWTGGVCGLIVNGACNPATNGVQTYIYPGSNHCNAGIKQDMDTVANDLIFNWNCNGINGGTNAPCTAPRRRDGACDNAVALGCTVGSSKLDNGNTSCSATRTWYCGGINGGLDSIQCGLANATCPTCGGTDNTCGVGTPSIYVAGSCGSNSTWNCNNGGYSTSCSKATAATCPCNSTPRGVMTHGTSNTAYSASTVACGSLCSSVSQVRTCTNGTLSGTYTNTSCSVIPCNCTGTPRGTVLHGNSVTAYSVASVSCPASPVCAGRSQTRTCTNGTLSGTYTNTACTNNANSQGCVITNGAGNQTCSAGTTSRGLCTVVTCNLNYHQEGNTCVRDAQCAGSANTCTYGSPSGYNAGSCGGSQTWTCTNGTDTDACSLANAACPVCNNSVALGCSPGSYTSDGGQTSCNTTRTWYCSNGGYTSAQCSKANPTCVNCTGTPRGTVPHGVSVEAYQDSRVGCGSSCSSERRTCDNGTLGGSYSNTSCSVDPCDCTGTPRGTVSHGSSVQAYQSSSVSCGSTCSWERRTCNDGTLWGSYGNTSCSVGSDPTCGGSANTCGNGSPSGYSAGSCGGSQTWDCNVPGCGTSCSLANAACPTCGSADGQTYDDPPGILGSTCGIGWESDFSTAYSYRSWSCNAAGTYIPCGANRTIVDNDCTGTPRGTVSHGASVPAYQTSSVSCGNSCALERRTCNNGDLGGSYGNTSCSEDPCDCTGTPRGTVAHGAGVTAYQSSSVSCGSSCSSERRTCNNGSLGGSYSNTSCSEDPCDCTGTPRGTVSHGSSVQAYQDSSVSCGSSCSWERRTCNNGSLGGSYSNTSCSEDSCDCYGTPRGTVADGASVTAYYSVNGYCPTENCTSETRTCTNGSLGGSYTATSCTNNSDRQPCGVSNGGGAESCSAGSTSRGTCNVSRCYGGYHEYSNACYEDPTCGSADGQTYDDPPGILGSTCGIGWESDFSTTSSYRSRRCNNGGTYVNCSANRTIVDYDCLGTPRGTVSAGDSVLAYSQGAGSCSQHCSTYSERRTCNGSNGVLGGSYGYTDCTSPLDFGVCGSNPGSYSSEPPNLCSEGWSAGTPSASHDTWYWGCEGCVGGEGCSAAKFADGVCINNSGGPICAEGPPSSVIQQGTCGAGGMWFWQCAGYGGGTSDDCRSVCD